MSERYSRIFSLPENLYAQGAQVLIKAGALLKDNESGQLIGQLKLLNISNKIVKLAKAEITCLDALGRELGEAIVSEYLDLSAKRGMDFGSKQPIKVANAATRSFSVRIVEVGFADNTVWADPSSEWKPIPKQIPISSVLKSGEAVQGYGATFGENAEMAVSVYDDLWCCACGEINHQGEAQCYKCGASLEQLQNVDEEELRSLGIYNAACKLADSDSIAELTQAKAEFSKIPEYIDSAALIKSCEEKIESIQNEQKKSKEKRKKTTKLASLIACGLVVLGLVGYFALYPLISYWGGNYAIYINMYNVDEFEVPEGTTRIEDAAFYQCTGLTSITIPDSVTSIGYAAFSHCSSLTSVTIPNSVTTIGGYAFSGCFSLTTITIPDSVTEIGGGAFAYCGNLTSVTIGNSVTTIGKYAFEYCDSLTSVTIPDSVKTIGKGAFEYCDSLTSVTISDSVTEIGSRAFADCDSLTSVTIPDSVTEIGHDAFAYCDILTSIQYKGTKTQWRKISLGNHWEGKITKVICLDGDIVV